MSNPFRERNPVIIGAVSLAVIAALILAAFRAQDLPLIGGGDTYYAAFSEAGGLKANDEVRIAGVRVGKVETVELDGDHVKVDLPGRRATPSSATRPRPRSRSRPCSARCSSRSSRPASGQLDEGAEIPVERTSSPYDVVEAFSGLAETSEQIDTDQLAESLTTLADLTRNTPEEFRAALDGVSRAVGERRRQATTQINALLENLEQVSDGARRARPRTSSR